MKEEQIVGDVKIVLMKSGVPLIVKRETGEKIEKAMINQERHSFIKITELDITINTAESSGVYNKKQWSDLMKVKAGQWICDCFQWHIKGEKCDCRQKARDEERKAQEKKDEEEANRVLTPEQLAKNKRRMAEIRESLHIKVSVPKK